jgi:hypothetical protein
MSLAQAPLNPVNINIVTTDPNYAAIERLKPSWYLKTGLNLLLGIAGVGSFIFLLLGGIQWITAGGDKDAVDKARKKITGALIGLAIVFSAYCILYIIRALFNVNLIQFEISPLGTISGSPSPGGSGGYLDVIPTSTPAWRIVPTSTPPSSMGTAASPTPIAGHGALDIIPTSTPPSMF